VPGRPDLVPEGRAQLWRRAQRRRAHALPHGRAYARLRSLQVRARSLSLLLELLQMIE